ncbi:MAG: M48 family metallopeptidase [candidate division Zixibacteria bacterium]|nr:M48 family metallopeptidase [candidate division Zixibacteria bacterium]
MRLSILVFSLLLLTGTIFAGVPDSSAVPPDTSSIPASDTISSAATKTSSADFEYPMSPDRKAKLISYSKFVNGWRFISFFVSIAILIIVLYTGLSARFRKWALGITQKQFLVYLLYFIFFLLFMTLINFPVDYYRNFVVEHDYGFSNQTFGQWMGDNLKTFAVIFIFGFFIFLILYWLINRFKKWWLYFAIGIIPFMVLVIVIFPVLVAPIFNKFEPIKNQELKTEMIALASRAGITNPDIYEVDASKQSSKVNAYFTGMFGTKRIVLYDTSIKNFSVNELKFIMGHEIGHYLKNHIWYGLFIAVVIMFLMGYLIDKLLPRFISRQSRRLGFTHLGDMASLPLILLFVTIFSFITQPIENGASRYFEYQSDQYGLEISGVTGDEAVTAFDKLSVANLSDPEPPALIEFWFYDHPALKKRMENARMLYRRTHPGV